MNRWNDYDLLRLALIKKLNSQFRKEIVEKYQSFEDFFNSPNLSPQYAAFRETELFPETQIDEEAEKRLEICSKHDIEIVTIHDSKYPERLKEIAYPPSMLFVKGTLQAPDAIAVGMVGTRKATRYGKLTAERYAAAFSEKRLVVVSGLAYGIDTYSHMTCVSAKSPTYAVIASGIDKLGPSDAKEKARKIVDAGGAIISHFLPGISALPPYFLHRNRVIAGISSAVVIIESGYKGGALNTARHAAEESREVFAVPGNIGSEKSIGTNNLIKNGTAGITTQPEDILKAVGVDTNGSENKKKEIEFQNDTERKLYEALSLEPLHIDILPEKSGLEVNHILVTLLDMEFRGLVRQLPGKYYVLP